MCCLSLSLCVCVCVLFVFDQRIFTPQMHSQLLEADAKADTQLSSLSREAKTTDSLISLVVCAFLTGGTAFKETVEERQNASFFPSLPFLHHRNSADDSTEDKGTASSLCLSLSLLSVSSRVCVCLCLLFDLVHASIEE